MGNNAVQTCGSSFLSHFIMSNGKFYRMVKVDLSCRVNTLSTGWNTSILLLLWKQFTQFSH